MTSFRDGHQADALPAPSWIPPTRSVSAGRSGTALLASGLLPGGSSTHHLSTGPGDVSGRGQTRPEAGLAAAGLAGDPGGHPVHLSAHLCRAGGTRRLSTVARRQLASVHHSGTGGGAPAGPKRACGLPLTRGTKKPASRGKPAKESRPEAGIQAHGRSIVERSLDSGAGLGGETTELAGQAEGGAGAQDGQGTRNFRRVQVVQPEVARGFCSGKDP